MVAYAVRITEENRQAIASEHPYFDTDEFQHWLDDHEVGFFLRDPQSIFDCRYFEEVVLLEMYRFVRPRSGEMFQPVERR